MALHRPTYRDALALGRLLKATERDYTRADDGKFSETSGGGSKAKEQPKKDTRTTQEKANQNRAQVAEQTGLGSELDGAMARLNAGMGGQADEAKADQLVERGLAQKDATTGRYSLSPEGKRYYAAAKKGDADGARVAMGDAKDRQAGAKAKTEARQTKTKARETAAADRKTKTEAAAAERKQKAAERDKAKAKAKAKGSSTKPSEEDKAKAKEEATARRKEEQAQAREGATQQAAERAGVPPADLNALRTTADGTPAVSDESASRLLASGLMERVNGQYQLTREGQSALRSLERGDSRGVVAARQQAQRTATPTATTKASSRDTLLLGRALAKRASAAAPTTTYAPIDADALSKSGAEERIVYGIASSPEVDNQPGVWEGKRYEGDVVESSAIEAALDDYLEYANVREMHAPKAVGTVIKAEMVDGQLRIAVRVEDDDAWRKVKAGVYKGFSIGGRALKAILAQLADGRIVRRITKLLLTEISLVDRPAHPAARILLFKSQGVSMPEEITEGRAALDLAALAALAKAASPDPMKATTMLQSIRDELELSGDVEGAGLMSQAISLVLQAAGEAETPAGDETEEEVIEEDAELEMAEEPLDDDPAAIMAAQRATLLKSARMRMGKRLPGIVGIAKSLLQLAADAGDEASARALKAYGADTVKVLTEGDVAKVVDAALTKLLAPVAAGVLNNHQRLEAIERQPAAGGPLTRIAGQAITKRLGDEQQPAVRTVDPATLARLRQLAATESNPALRDQYKAQLKQIEAQH